MIPCTEALILLACSATKLSYPAPAIDLYRGVMYGTLRANVRPDSRPHVVILSAQHGFIPGDAVIEPYEQTLTSARAGLILRSMEDYMHGCWPRGVSHVLLAGGAEYRRVMRAAVHWLGERGYLTTGATVTETTGGLGYQRQQLGAFVRAIRPRRDVVGYHGNGTPLYSALGGFTVGQAVNVVYSFCPKLAPMPAVIEELFNGPSGLTACVRVLGAKNQTCAQRWVGLRNLR